MFILQLNPIKAKSEVLQAVIRAETPEKLLELVEKEKVTEWRDGEYMKHFRNGGPLEWFNPPTGEVGPNDVPYIFDVGDADEWARMAKEDFDEKIMALASAETFLDGVQL